MSRKHEKMMSLIWQEAAKFIARNAGSESLITVTDVDISSDYKRSTIYVSVLPEEQEERALGFINRKAGEFRSEFRSKTSVRVIPFFDFQIDKGEKARRKIEELSGDD